MPKLTGVFETFKNLDQIAIDDISHWLKAKEQDSVLENYIGNRLLYPQTVPVTAWDMEIDLAILREYLRAHADNYYNPTRNQFIIPEEFIARFAPVTKLMSAILDIIKPKNEVSTLMLEKQNHAHVAGSLIMPNIKFEKSFAEIAIDDASMRYQVGSIHLIPIQDTQVKIKIDATDLLFVPGGEIGILIDLREKEEEDDK